MAKILCGISGIEFTCEHLPIYLNSREYAHPIFFLPQKRLLGLYQKSKHSELPEIDEYLLFLAYLNSTDLVEWRVPAQRTPETRAIIAKNFESLVYTVEKMNCVSNPNVHFARVAVTPETKTLQNVHFWIKSWKETYEDFLDGFVEKRTRQDINALETRLEHLAKDANRKETIFAARLANWAAKAAAFPRFPVQIAKTTITCSDYWKQIIRKCTSEESIFTIPSKDLQELLEHCEENLDAGSIYTYHLFKILREGVAKQNNFLGLGSFEFSILTGDESTEKANKLAIINNAPEDAPRRLDYPSQFAFLKAKLAYDLKKGEENE